MLQKIIKQYIIRFFGFLAKKKLCYANPVIIAVTGSVGKTTTKEMIASVLETTFRVKKTTGNYNSDIGLPLAILDQKAGYSFLSWAKVFLASILNVVFQGFYKKEKYDFFVIEMGADKPGDIQYLTGLFTPHISVVTNVAKMHMEEGQFENEEAVFHEKSALVSCLQKNDIALLNGDNAWVKKMKQLTKAQVLFYGKNKKNDISVETPQRGVSTKGINFSLMYQGQKHLFSSPILAEFLVSSFLPAIAIGLLYDISIENIQQAVASFTLPHGRFNIIEGIKGTTIIDSTYNASPYATIECLLSFSHLPGRKIAVLGNMNELGKYSEEEHRRVGKEAASLCDMLVTLGKDAEYIADEAKKYNPSLSVYSFFNRQDVVNFLQQTIETGDILLFKGSQNGVFLEEVIKEIMKYPEQAKDVLVRQGEEWEKIKMMRM